MDEERDGLTDARFLLRSPIDASRMVLCTLGGCVGNRFAVALSFFFIIRFSFLNSLASFPVWTANASSSLRCRSAVVFLPIHFSFLLFISFFYILPPDVCDLKKRSLHTSSLKIGPPAWHGTRRQRNGAEKFQDNGVVSNIGEWECEETGMARMKKRSRRCRCGCWRIQQ